MRAISSLVVLAAFASCSAIDNFGKFTVGGGDMGGGCTPGCDCIAADSAVGVPAHCRVAPLGAFACTGTHATVTLAAGEYHLDSGAVPPELDDPSGKPVATGVVNGVTALFCVGSFVSAPGTHITIVNDRPVAIVADSLVRMSTSAWTLGGGYATDMNGAPGFAGGSFGGTGGIAGDGPNGGSGGSGSPGTGGGGGGATTNGAPGGSAVGGGATPGGASSSMATPGGGGGGGGMGSTFGGGGGGGGGVLQLSASWAIELDSVTFDASGGGGAGGGPTGSAGGMAGGGGGGGAGGVLALDAPMVDVTGGCLSVIGGPGGAGGALTRGGDARPTALCGFVGTGGIAAPNGGGGGSAGVGASSGGNGTNAGGGGGGLGSYGRVTIRSRNPPPASAAPGVVPPQAYLPLTLP